MYYTHQILIAINKCVIYLMLILLFVTLTGNTAYAYSYEVTERLVPWGDGPGEVYTDVFDFDWGQFEYGIEPIYPEAWDSWESTAYICDFDMNSLNASLIEINMNTGQVLETTIDYPVYPEEIKIIGGEDEYFVLGQGQYWCYDYDLSKIWAIGLASIDKVACLNSSIYKLNNNLWGVVMTISEGWGQPNSYELWKINLSNELVGRVLLDPPLEGESCVFDISPDGEVSFGSYTDMYGGISRWNSEGNLERREGGRIWEFENPDEAPEGFLYGPAHDLKVNYDASVFSFQYTEEGIKIKRYKYVP